MNTYTKPEIEVIELEASDVIAVSSEFDHNNSYGDISDLFKVK